jgi:hypothetical protein
MVFMQRMRMLFIFSQTCRRAAYLCIMRERVVRLQLNHSTPWSIARKTRKDYCTATLLGPDHKHHQLLDLHDLHLEAQGRSLLSSQELPEAGLLVTGLQSYLQIWRSSLENMIIPMLPKDPCSKDARVKALPMLFLNFSLSLPMLFL